jgi:hypothetical protein
MGDGLIEIGKILAGLDATRKPLAKVVPKLTELREDPAKVLEEADIEIKVCPPYGACTFVGLFFPGLLVVPLFVNLLKCNPNGPEGSLIFLTWLLSSALFGVAVGRLISRGKVLLRLRGLEVHDRRSYVFCPWSIFCVDGEPEITGRTEIWLPIQPELVPLIECHRIGQEQKTGSFAQNAHLRFSSTQTQIILKDHYLAKGLKLGQLILDLGRHLGEGRTHHSGL